MGRTRGRKSVFRSCRIYSTSDLAPCGGILLTPRPSGLAPGRRVIHLVQLADETDIGRDLVTPTRYQEPEGPVGVQAVRESSGQAWLRDWDRRSQAVSLSWSPPEAAATEFRTGFSDSFVGFRSDRRALSAGGDQAGFGSSNRLHQFFV